MALRWSTRRSKELSYIVTLTGFPLRLENMENENGRRKVIEFWDQPLDFTNFPPDC